jgi:phage/plasmid primase-like uncharacterized protein
MVRQGSLEKLEGPLRPSAERSYAAWAEAKLGLARRHDIADYVSYVQDQWPEEKRSSKNLVEIPIASRLLILMRNMDGEVRNLQIIDDDGQKMFARDGEAAGSHFVIGDVQSPWPLHFTEGYDRQGNSRRAAVSQVCRHAHRSPA